MVFNSSISRRGAVKLISGAALAGATLGPRAFAQGTPEKVAITDDLIKAAQKEGQLYYRYSALQEPSEAIGKAFKAKYGIEVTAERRVAAQGTNAFATEERSGKHIVDVHGSSDRKGYLDLTKEGLYLPFTIANIDQYAPGNTLPGYGYAIYYSASILCFNTDRLPLDDGIRLFTNSWQGLVDPRFKGKRIGILSPFITSASSFWYWALAISPKYGTSFLQKVADQDPVIYPDQAVGEEAVYAGEVDLLIGEVVEPAEAAYARGAKIAWTYPDILPVSPAVMHFISAHAPHPNAARLFMAWALSLEGQTLISRDIGRLTTIKADVPRPPAIQAALAKASWWKPYPQGSGQFTPGISEIVEKEDSYRQEMAKMFNIRTAR